MLLSSESSLHTVDTSDISLSDISLQTFSPTLSQSSYSLHKAFHRKKSLIFDEVKFVTFSIYRSCFRCQVEELCLALHPADSPCFSFLNILQLCILHLSIMMHFQLIFIKGVRFKSRCILLIHGSPSSPAPYVEKSIFLHVASLVLLLHLCQKSVR